MVVVVVVTGWYLHWCGSLWAFQSRHLFIILTSVLSIKEYWDILPLQWSVLTPSVLLTRPVQTVKDDTAYTQVSNKPDETPEAPANQPMRNGSYIAMSPVEAQKCWSRIPSPSVELRKGAEGAAHGRYITTGGGLHTLWAHFHLFWGGVGGVGRIGKGVGHKPQ